MIGWSGLSSVSPMLGARQPAAPPLHTCPASGSRPARLLEVNVAVSGIVRPELRLADFRSCLPVQRLRLCVAALRLEQTGQAVKRRRSSVWSGSSLDS